MEFTKEQIEKIKYFTWLHCDTIDFNDFQRALDALRDGEFLQEIYGCDDDEEFHKENQEEVELLYAYFQRELDRNKAVSDSWENLKIQIAEEHK